MPGLLQRIGRRGGRYEPKMVKRSRERERDKVIVKIYPVHLINVEQCQVASDPQEFQDEANRLGP